MSCPLSALATIAAMTATQLQQDESYLPYNDPVVAGADAAVCKQETDDEGIDATAEVAADHHQSTATSSSDDDSHASGSSSGSTSPKKPMKKRAVPADHVYNYSQQSYYHQDYHHHHYESSSSVDEKDSQERIVREEQPPLKRHRSVPGPNNKKRTKQITKKSNSNNPARRPRSNSSLNNKGGTSKTTNNQPSFPALLMGIMSASQNKEYISFLSDDRSFIIVNPEMLVSHVLPMYFTERDNGDDDDDTMNFGDFLKLLDVWGFENTTEPQYPQVDVYKHPKFRKGDWEACLEITLPAELADKLANKKKTKSPSRNNNDSNNTRSRGKQQVAVQQPPSPRQHSIPEPPLAVEHQPCPTIARSVTPPEVPSSPVHTTTMTAAQQEWMMKSAALEQLIKATAATRRNLSGYKNHNQGFDRNISPTSSREQESAALNYSQELSNSRNAQDLMLRNNMAIQSRCSTKNRMRFGAGGHPSSVSSSAAALEASRAALSDAHVNSVTSGVVSAAMAALNPEHEVKTLSPPSLQQNTYSRLDAMTEAFLERSNARTMRSRPVGIYGSCVSRPVAAPSSPSPPVPAATAVAQPSSPSPSMTQLSDAVDAQTRAMLMKRRRKHQKQM